MITTAAGLGMSLIARILKQSWPLIATVVLCVIYVAIYEQALRGGI